MTARAACARVGTGAARPAVSGVHRSGRFKARGTPPVAPWSDLAQAATRCAGRERPATTTYRRVMLLATLQPVALALLAVLAAWAG